VDARAAWPCANSATEPGLLAPSWRSPISERSHAVIYCPRPSHVLLSIGWHFARGGLFRVLHSCFIHPDPRPRPNVVLLWRRHAPISGHSWRKGDYLASRWERLHATGLVLCSWGRGLCWPTLHTSAVKSSLRNSTCPESACRSVVGMFPSHNCSWQGTLTLWDDTVYSLVCYRRVQRQTFAAKWIEFSGSYNPKLAFISKQISDPSRNDQGICRVCRGQMRSSLGPAASSQIATSSSGLHTLSGSCYKTMLKMELCKMSDKCQVGHAKQGVSFGKYQVRNYAFRSRAPNSGSLFVHESWSFPLMTSYVLTSFTPHCLF